MTDPSNIWLYFTLIVTPVEAELHKSRDKPRSPRHAQYDQMKKGLFSLSPLVAIIRRFYCIITELVKNNSVSTSDQMGLGFFSLFSRDEAGGNHSWVRHTYVITYNHSYSTVIVFPVRYYLLMYLVLLLRPRPLFMSLLGNRVVFLWTPSLHYGSWVLEPLNTKCGIKNPPSFH